MIRENDLLKIYQDKHGKLTASHKTTGNVFPFPWPQHPLESIMKRDSWKKVANEEYTSVYSENKDYSYYATVLENDTIFPFPKEGFFPLLFHPKGYYKQLITTTPI